ncbi:phosphoglycerate transporter family protein [Calidithermus terrae]|uniref:Phosphoglycerate transporter family protein n=2 Tax=Calidithermus terrae TaxID=1408545 RepID=A0A399E2Y0_9DEIN|nr:phosphoglycerate transporter family protein [Calidithermus terrae]
MGALKAFSLWFPPYRYATVSSVYVALGGLGAIAAATPLAVLKEALGWRGVFSWGTLVIVAVAALVVLLVRNAPPGVALPRSSAAGGSATVWRSPAFWRIAWLNFVLGGGFLAWQTLWGGAYLYRVRGLDSLEVGNFLFAFSLAAILGFFSCGLLADRLGLSRVYVGASLLLALAVGTLALWGTMPDGLLYATYALIGFCGGFNILSLAQARLIFPPELTGRATTAVNFMGFIGVFLLQLGMGVVVQASGYPLALAIWFGLLVSAVVLYAPMLKAGS